MKRYLLAIAVLLINCCLLCAQGFSFDSTSIYKNTEGKVISFTEAKELMKSPFNMRTEAQPDGKKIITILPLPPGKKDSLAVELESIRKGFLDRPLADFSFKDMNGKKLVKKELKGRVLVINFWFTACKPCVAEIPLLNEMTSAYKGKNVLFIAPGLDEKPMVEKFLLKHPFFYQVVADQEGYADEMKMKIFPTHLIADKKGIIRQVIVGYHTDIKEQLGKAIDGLL